MKLLFALLFDADFPVDQKRQRAAQGDDRAQDEQLRPLSDDHGTQHLAAQLEFQRQGNARGQIQAEMLGLAELADDGLRHRDQQNGDARQLRQGNADLRRKMDDAFQKMHNCFHHENLLVFRHYTILLTFRQPPFCR